MAVRIRELKRQPLSPSIEYPSVPVIDQIPRNVARDCSRSLSACALLAIVRDRTDLEEDIADIEIAVMNITTRDDQKSFDDAALYLAMIS